MIHDVGGDPSSAVRKEDKRCILTRNFMSNISEATREFYLQSGTFVQRMLSVFEQGAPHGK